MNLINPIAMLFSLLAGAIVLMYLLKLRRRKEEFSSTLLWTKAIQDLTANAPLQKLRNNPLMYLQILALVLLVLALARPTLWLRRTQGESHIVLIDNSASMNATDIPDGRLAEAKRVAERLADNMTGGDEMMIVTFGSAARIVQPFSSEKAVVKRAIGSIKPTDGEARAREALQMVRGLRKVAASPRITIISDGGVGYLGNMITEKDAVDFVPIGTSGENRGIVAFDLRESFEQRGQAQLFAEVENFGEASSNVLVRCLVDGVATQAREAMIEAGARQGFTFEGLDATSHRVRIEISPPDLLAGDDSAEGLLDLHTERRVLLVTNGSDYFLERALGLLPSLEISRIEPAAYDPTQTWDLVIFDQCAPPTMGPGRYLFLHAVPPMEGFAAAAEPLKNQVAVDWSRIHPVTRYLSFEELALAEAMKVTAPDWMTRLVESPEAPLVMAGENKGIKIALVAFDLYQSNWPMQVSFPIFLSNTFNWMLAREGRSGTSGYRCGETITLDGKPGETTPVALNGPEGESWSLVPNEMGRVFFNQATRAGYYEASQGGKPIGAFAINVLSQLESKIKPAGEIISGEQKIVASVAKKENREVWPWFAALALAALAIEWHWYCRRSWL